MTTNKEETKLIAVVVEAKHGVPFFKHKHTIVQVLEVEKDFDVSRKKAEAISMVGGVDCKIVHMQEVKINKPIIQ